MIDILVAGRWRKDDPREIRIRASWNMLEGRDLMLCVSRWEFLVQQKSTSGFLILTKTTQSIPYLGN